MYKTLKRTAFAEVQSKMFPMYFMAGFITSSVALLTHLHINPVISWQNDRIAFYQVRCGYDILLYTFTIY
jgi:hypothetical protein